MGIKSIRVENLLSFKDINIQHMKDINCIIGQNNAGKSNLLTLINYFYNKLDNKSVLPPNLHSKYSESGSITITYDTSRIRRVVTSAKTRNSYQKHIFKILFSGEIAAVFRFKTPPKPNYSESTHTLKPTINKDNSIIWSDNREEYRDILSRLYPFFSIDTRRLDLYDWGKLWGVVSKLKFLNIQNLKKTDLVDYINTAVSSKSNSYKDFVSTIEAVTSTSEYSYQEKLHNYLKVGLEGHSFNIEGFSLDSQSDGTNSFRYLEMILHLMLALTRREYITPTVFIDEPEIGLHPKRSEELIYNLHLLYESYKKTSLDWEKGKYQTPYPKIIFSTHSPNILKSIVKLFNQENEHQILQFSIGKDSSTKINVMDSHYSDRRFLNVFSDNEARLFFSTFILFVEGATEQEVFSNLKLAQKFPELRKIDIYPFNDMVLKAINPSNVNLSTPYLILFDSDLLVDINLYNGKLSFKNKKVDLKSLAKKYRYSYFNSKEYSSYKAINNVLKQEKTNKKLKSNKLQFDVFNYTNFINYINRSCLYDSKTMVTVTTIEGALISIKSFNMFVMWIMSTIVNYSEPTQKGKICKTVQSIKARYLAKNITLKGAFCAFVKISVFNVDLTDDERSFTKGIKLKYLAKTKKEIISRGFSTAELVEIFRIAFEGKSESLVSKDNQSYSNLPTNVRELVDDIRNNYLSSFPYNLSKTSGWVTSFLNFSIDQIENTSSKNENSSFEQEFKETFPELDDILRVASIAID